MSKSEHEYGQPQNGPPKTRESGIAIAADLVTSGNASDNQFWNSLSKEAARKLRDQTKRIAELKAENERLRECRDLLKAISESEGWLMLVNLRWRERVSKAIESGEAES